MVAANNRGPYACGCDRTRAALGVDHRPPDVNHHEEEGVVVPVAGEAVVHLVENDYYHSNACCYRGCDGGCYGDDAAVEVATGVARPADRRGASSPEKMSLSGDRLYRGDHVMSGCCCHVGRSFEGWEGTEGAA